MKSFLSVFGCLIGIFCTLSGSQVQNNTVTLALVGDLMLGRGVAETHQAAGWEGIFMDIHPELQIADIALGNLESPLGTSPDCINGSRGYNLCADDSATDALASAGFDMLVTANNHHYDCGLDNPSSTRDILNAAGITALDENNSPLEKQVRGIKLAFLAYDDISHALDKPKVLSTIQEAASINDVVIVSMHWGMEYQGGPTSRQKRLAREISRAGADLVWGHHPHVLQRMEWIERNNDQPPTLVAYSLGNALFDQTYTTDTRQSVILQVKIDKEGVASVNATPYMIGWQNHIPYLPDPATRRSILRQLHLDEPMEK